MPRTIEMSWVPKRHRWQKLYKGTKFVVSCAQLGLPKDQWTKEASLQLANDWWQKQLASTNANPDAAKYDQAIEVLRQRAEWCQQHNEPDNAKTYLETAQEAEQAKQADEPFDWRRWTDPFPDRIWQDRLQSLQTRAIASSPKSKTVKQWADEWFALQLGLARAGEMAIDRAINNKQCLSFFLQHLGEGADPAKITAQVIDSYRVATLARVKERQDLGKPHGLSRAYAKDLFIVLKSFLKQLWIWEAIDLPRNLDKLKLSAGKTTPITMEPATVKLAIDAAKKQLKLHLLLMANCGMTQQDIADLQQSEVDWREGRIKRKRSKTEQHENVPTVEYKLWKTTFNLLKQYRSSDAKLALLTESGLPWVRKSIKADNTLSKTDAIASCYVHLAKKLGLPSLNKIRKTSSTILESHLHYKTFTSLFLGHSPKDIKEINYAVYSQDLFDEAIRWLGEQYGF